MAAKGCATELLLVPLWLMSVPLSSCFEQPLDGGAAPELSAAEDESASVRFALVADYLLPNASVRICGASALSEQPPLKRCRINLLEDPDNPDSCPCFNINDGMPEVTTLCPSEGPNALWTFSYSLFSSPDCTGAPINGTPPPTLNPNRLICYDSHSLRARTDPNQTVDDPIFPGSNLNYVVCLSCKEITRVSDLPPNVRYDCGCMTATGAASGCQCASLGVPGTPPDLPASLPYVCSFNNAHCEILCASPPPAELGGTTSMGGTDGTGGTGLPRIEVTNNGATTLTNYPVHVVLDTRPWIQVGALAADCSNLRIFGDTGCSQARSFFLPAYSCNTATTEIWLLVPTLAPGTREVFSVELSTLGQGSNGDQVFPALFDDFTGTALDSALWTTSGMGTLTISGGILRSQGPRLLQSVALLSADTQVAGMRVAAESKIQTDVEFGMGTVSAIAMPNNVWSFSRTWLGMTILSWEVTTIGFQTTTAAGACHPTAPPADSIGPAWADFGVPATFQTVEFRYSVATEITGTLQSSRGGTWTGSTPLGCIVSPPRPVLIVPDHESDTGDPLQQIDYVYIRPFSTPEPTGTFLSNSTLACGTQP